MKMNQIYLSIFVLTMWTNCALCWQNTNFTLVTPDGGEIIGDYDVLLDVLDFFEDRIENATGYTDLLDVTYTKLREKKQEIVSRGDVARSVYDRELSDIFWDFVEQKFDLIGLELKINNRPIRIWSKKK